MKAETRQLKKELIEKITHEVINNGKKVYDMANYIYVKNGKVYLDNSISEFPITTMGIEALQTLYDDLR